MTFPVTVKKAGYWNEKRHQNQNLKPISANLKEKPSTARRQKVQKMMRKKIKVL